MNRHDPHGERDPLRELRMAWDRLAPRDPLEIQDSIGERATANVRAAWKRIEAPVSRLPEELLARSPRFETRHATRRVVSALRWALAAGIAGVALYGAWKAALAPQAARQIEPRAALDPLAAQAPRMVRSVPITALTPHSMELRSGNVRLTLFTPARPSHSTQEPPR
jgi:hypothetical protein